MESQWGVKLHGEFDQLKANSISTNKEAPPPPPPPDCMTVQYCRNAGAMDEPLPRSWPNGEFKKNRTCVLLTQH